MADATVLTFIDGFADETDPSLASNFRLAFATNAPFELRTQDSAEGPQQVGTLEAIAVKVLVQGSDADLTAVRIELSSESDLFFHYSCTLLEQDFALALGEALGVDFPELPGLLKRMLRAVSKDPQTNLAVFVISSVSQRTGRLDFIQNSEERFDELLSLPFLPTPESFVQTLVRFKYNELKTKLALATARLQDVGAVAKAHPEVTQKLAVKSVKGKR
jgi:hypothetical protein